MIRDEDSGRAVEGDLARLKTDKKSARLCWLMAIGILLDCLLEGMN